LLKTQYSLNSTAVNEALAPAPSTLTFCAEAALATTIAMTATLTMSMLFTSPSSTFDLETPARPGQADRHEPRTVTAYYTNRTKS
jgi:hypothetical protein